LYAAAPALALTAELGTSGVDVEAVGEVVLGINLDQKGSSASTAELPTSANATRTRMPAGILEGRLDCQPAVDAFQLLLFPLHISRFHSFQTHFN
jgi:hypothetical protein